MLGPDESREGSEETTNFVDRYDSPLNSPVVDIVRTGGPRLREIGVKLVRSDDTGHETLFDAMQSDYAIERLVSNERTYLIITEQGVGYRRGHGDSSYELVAREAEEFAVHGVSNLHLLRHG